MDNKKQQELFDRYPLIFQDKDKPITESCMGWGIDVPDEWYDLIDSLCSLIHYYCKFNPDVEQVVAEQVKEKFGGLRFYYRGGDGDQYIRGMISLAEVLSERIH